MHHPRPRFSAPPFSIPLLATVLSCSVSFPRAQSIPSASPYTTTLVNLKGFQQPTRFDTRGEAVDAHDGEIAFFGGLYYLYGTSYDCGFRWGLPGAPFCGFKAYSSPDLAHWTDRGKLFDASTAAWQKSCDGNSYGCYRPHVLYNQAAKEYVLWINVYDNSTGFHVLTAKDPAGPFTEVADPKLAVNNTAPAAGLNNGDHDTFLDEDGTAYIAYTDWRTGGRIAIEKLDASFRSGSGSHVEGVTPGSTEAPALFRRGSLYYLTYSDPNCGYCATGTSYRTAPSPLGPWSAGKPFSSKSCGGQPSFVSSIALASGPALIYGSDLWNNQAKNEALANYYWAPLSFKPDGSLDTLVCRDNETLDLAVGEAGSQLPIPDLDATAGVDGFTGHCDIKAGIQRAQTFTATRTGTLTSVAFTTFQNGLPDAALQIEIHAANASFQPVGDALSTTAIEPGSIGWSARRITVKPGIPVVAGSRYALVAKSAAAQGCYGLEYNDTAPYRVDGVGGGEAYSNNGGGSFAAEAKRTLKFETTVRSTTALRGGSRPAWDGTADGAAEKPRPQGNVKVTVFPGDVDAKGSRLPPDAPTAGAAKAGVRYRIPSPER